jgi:hypothetical protein
MSKRSVFAAAGLALAVGATAAPPLAAQPRPMSEDMAHVPGGKRIRITYENLTNSQTFSPSVFVSHNASAPPLFGEGMPASFGLQRMAEEGNTGPFLSGMVIKDLGGAFGAAAQGISVAPGKSRTVELDVDREHPMVSGFWMLVMTNDGFTGVNGVNALALERPMSMELYAWDAGTEQNTERREHLVALMGPGRAPENGRVMRHRGIRGDADAPAMWRFDAQRPVARVTIAPAM